MCKDVEPTTLSSKKLWIVGISNFMAFLAYFHASALSESEAQVALLGHLLTFLFMFNTAYSGINAAQKWVLK